ncbi:MAG: CHAT domain-containing protein [Chitinophagaceae bacterium]|nr:CHAT domain-containing protein [Chitinophagaceae bacterium]MCW5906079.1 CHAT domain-containing protein [Chitinophagaceae bacterium]
MNHFFISTSKIFSCIAFLALSASIYAQSSHAYISFFKEGKFKEASVEVDRLFKAGKYDQASIYGWVLLHKKSNDIHQKKDSYTNEINLAIHATLMIDSLNKNPKSQSLEQYIKQNNQPILWASCGLRQVAGIFSKTDPFFADAVLVSALPYQKNSFNFIRAYNTLISQNFFLRKKLQQRLADKTFTDYPLLEKQLHKLIAYYPTEATDWIFLSKEFIAEQKEDAYAYRSLADNLYTLKYYEEAAQNYITSFEKDPFTFEDNLTNAAACYIRIQQENKADSLINYYCKLYKKGNFAENVRLQKTILYKNDGNYGAALELLVQPFTESFNQQEGEKILADIYAENGSNNKILQYYLAKIKNGSNNIDDYTNLIHYYNTDSSYTQSMEVYQLAEAKFTEFSESFFYHSMNTFIAVKDNETVLNVLHQWNTVYPFSTWCLDNYASMLRVNKKYTQALTMLQKSFETVGANGTWRVNQLLRIFDDAKRVYEKASILDSMLQQYPDAEALWAARANIEESKTDKINIWNNAAAKNSYKVFPFYNMQLLNKDAASINNQITLLEAKKESFYENAQPSEKAKIDFEIARTYTDLLSIKTISKKVGKKAIEYFNTSIAKYGNIVNVYKHLDKVYNAIEDKDSAKTALLQSLIYNPDQSTSYWDLWAKYNYKNKIALYKKYMLRNPLHEYRTSTYVQLNTMWGGSVIEAVKYADIYVEKFPNSNYTNKVKGYKAQALSRLGDNKGYFESNFKDYCCLAKSETYIDWYNSAINAVQKGSNKIVVDTALCEAMIYFNDGTEAKYQDDCNCGKVASIQVGASFIQFYYNKDCDLTSIVSSDGYHLSLQYTANGLIQKMSSKTEGTLLLEYNSMKKPVKVITGNDTLILTYDETGEILTREANNGYASTLKISSLLQNLTAKTKLPQQALANIRAAKLPELNIDDKIYDSLYNKYNNTTKGTAAWIKAGIDLCKYMYKNITANASYGTNIVHTASNMFQVVKENKTLYNQGIELVDVFYNTLMQIRKKGVANNYWNTWVDMQDWIKTVLVTQKNNNKLFSLAFAKMEKYNKNPVVLLDESKWLNKNDIKNAGFWQDIYFSDFIPAKYANIIKPTKVYYAPDESVWAATNKGLFINTNGLWQYINYDIKKQKFVKAFTPANSFASSDINEVLWINDSLFFIATNDGLYRINGNNLLTAKTQKISELFGLSSNIINDIELVNNQYLLIATTKGLDVLNITQNTIVAAYLQNNAIGFVQYSHQSINNSFNKAYNIIAGITSKKIIGTILNDDATGWIFDDLYTGNYDYATFDYNGKIIYTVADKVFALQQENIEQKIIAIELTGNITTTNVKQVYGIEHLFLEEETPLGVLTDRGISIYQNNHFEHLDIPNVDGKFLSAIHIAKGSNGAMAVLSNDRISLYEKNNITYSPNKVTALLSMDSISMTIVATGRRLMYYTSQSNEPETFPSYTSSITHIAKEADTSFIAASGFNIIRFSINKHTGRVSEKELFYCDQTEPASGEKYTAGDVKKILVDKKGRIWIVTALAVFKYDANATNTVTEYNFFKNPNEFPSYTELVYNIVETIDGKIWVVCSNEKHLFYKSISLSGGLLQWNEEKQLFENLLRTKGDYTIPFDWFINSYTIIDSGKAIIGTASNFAEDYYGSVRDFYVTDHTATEANKSYLKLKGQKPSLFLGTEGASIGNIWLFGTASGVVCYANGVWFYPERFNQLLPKDMEYGAYGGRSVHAISVDKAGKIFVATNNGLLIYNSGGRDAVSLLSRNFNTSEMLTYYSQSQLGHEREAIINSIPKQSNAGKLLAEYTMVDKEIRKLQQQKGKSQFEMMRKGSNRKSNVDSLTSEQNKLTQKQMQILLQLEQQEPAIHQVLKVPPVELATSRNKLKDNECIIQYIPLANRLCIQFVSKQKLSFKEIQINQAQLMDSVMLAVASLSGRNVYPARGVHIRKSDNDKKSAPDINKTLAFLYDVLIQPIANDIEGYENVYLIPADKLFYLPFASLIHTNEKGEQRYLIEDHNIGFLSTIFLFDLVYNYKPSGKGDVYLFADPDGSLPFAKTEVAEIKNSITNSISYEGKAASVANLSSIADKCKVLHLATHGFLEKGKIDESWILFADKKLSMAEILTMKFPHAELAILSTCESALGADGIEYATLARAFNNAGVPSVLSTLWEINDKAAMEIMVEFYKNIQNGMNRFTALAASQRSYLAKYKTDAKAKPNYWAPFIILGKP